MLPRLLSSAGRSGHAGYRQREGSRRRRRRRPNSSGARMRANRQGAHRIAASAPFTRAAATTSCMLHPAHGHPASSKSPSADGSNLISHVPIIKTNLKIWMTEFLACEGQFLCTPRRVPPPAGRLGRFRRSDVQTGSRKDRAPTRSSSPALISSEPVRPGRSPLRLLQTFF